MPNNSQPPEPGGPVDPFSVEFNIDRDADIPWDIPTPAPPLTGGLFDPSTSVLPAPLRWNPGSPDRVGRYGYITIHTTGTLAEFQEAWAALAELKREHNIVLGQHMHERYTGDNGTRWRLPHTVLIQDADVPIYGPLYGAGQTQCWDCSNDVPVGVPECPNCGVTQYCSICNLWTGTQLIADDNDAEGSVLCENCSRPCLASIFTVGNPAVLCEVRTAFDRCADHAVGERNNCTNCGMYTDDGLGAEYSEYYDGTVCRNCVPNYCDRCDRETPYLTNGVCEDCEVAVVHADQGTETYEPEEKLERDLFVNAIPGRENIRRCGLEIEGGGNWRTMGQRLYDAGLTVHASMLEYHASTSGNASDPNRWSLERDGSVDWELVSPPINLADRDNVRTLRGVLKIVREEIKNESVSLDMRCGLHIHVGAERTAIGGAFNLGTVWGYLEDVIFRLGAAKWPKHRAIVNGLHYCRPTPKGAKTRLEFGLQMENQSEPRYNALSFNNYIRSMSRGCTCGAVRYDSWDQCVCDLGKCTFEFRVFNTSANMHKIHAYLALCQAMVAYATSRSDLDPDLFPAQEFKPRLVAEMGDVPRVQVMEDWKPRLQFLFNELPLTDPEKADLLYCVRSSELDALGEDFIKDLAPNNAQEVLI